MQTRLVCAGALVLGLFAPRAFAQIAARERVEAIMTTTGRDAMPLIEERLTVTVDDQHATTTLAQVYENNTTSRVEGRYRLRPGSKSHVDGFAYWNGEQKIVGEVFEKQLARKVYDSVTNQNRDPGILEQDGEGAFGFRVFPIDPKEKKRVELRWTQWLERRGKIIRYRAPITRADAEIVITITGAAKNLVTSSTHRLRIEPIEGGVRLRSEGANTTGEIDLEWETDDADWKPSAYAHSVGEHDGWFAVALAAPDVTDKAIAAKDVTIVIDRSGSMAAGDAMKNAREAAADMIKRLDSRDRINVIWFSDEVDSLFETPRVLDDANRAKAIEYAEKLTPSGGTDIALALRTAIKGQTRDKRPRVIVFMTDGQSEAKSAMEAARSDAGDIRLFTLGLGDQVNRPLLQRLAAEKRGRFIYIPNTAEIETEVGKLAASIAKPLLVGVSIDVEGAKVSGQYPRSLPDLFAEDELLITGRIKGKGKVNFIIRGQLGGKQVAFTQAVDLGKASTRPWVGRLWAQARIEHLLEEIALGDKSKELPDEVLTLALAYNFVTPYSAFLAIPESELGGMKSTIEEARARKSKILANNPDAAALRADANQHAVSLSGAPPAIDPGPPQRDYAGGDEDEESEALMSSGSVRGKRGCAGCATGGGDAGLLLLLALCALVRRRR